ncbi:Crp/Fnr family transcriptional regulator [Chondromyces crocatus]|uniref:cAMP-binding protein n=1 Tax=Chondromyces crocatus TaxID=52 RepID=A0A0K1ETG5_CHOCO|nr:cyclic nucleotide-binding domain-containing protein [Chondromyces crocatus]AKT44069.1 cAMP-binding protein [Chondromyces crocatus]
MALRPSDLHAIPVFEKITEAHLETLMAAFERRTLAADEVLFEAGTAPEHLHLLVSGEVALKEGATTRFLLNPIAPIGELGAVTGFRRATTAVTSKPSEVWSIGIGALRQFFEQYGDVAFPFYHNLLNIVADKLRRDQNRLEEVRTNLIRTQKGMKTLLDFVLENEETALSRQICATLEDLIEKNRRWHYLVEPSRTLKSSVRLDSGQLVPVQELSDGWLRLGPLPENASVPHEDWSGVLVLPSGEIPVSGRVEARDDGFILIRLDLLIDEYRKTLQDYLTRLELLDFVV